MDFEIKWLGDGQVLITFRVRKSWGFFGQGALGIGLHGLRDQGLGLPVAVAAATARRKSRSRWKQLQSLRAGERVDSKAAFKVLVRITFAVALAQHLSDLSCLLSTWETAPWVMEIDKDGGRGKKWRIFSNVFSFVLNNPRQVPAWKVLLCGVKGESPQLGPTSRNLRKA